MKKILLIFLSAILPLGLPAQTPDELLTLRMTDVPLSEVLTEMQNKTSYNFFFSTASPEMQKRVSVSFTDEPARNAISKVLSANGINYKINGKDVIVQAVKQQRQHLKVSGIVKDENGEPLPGAGVMVAGTGNGVVTDIDGRYSLEVELPASLEYSFIGYLTVTEKVTPPIVNSLDIQLFPDENRLEEVVVIGYGTLEKKQVTSSIASIKADDLVKGGGGATIATSLRGQVSGLTVNTSSSPNAGYGFQLRGVSSINADDAPLVVIDGIPGGHLSALNPDEIESIDILKDASAGAIYGTRAAGGVILVTTKHAEEGAITLTYTGELSTEAVRTRPHVLSRYRYLHYDIGTDYGSDTDWYGELLNEGALSWRHSLALTGGTKTSRLYANFMTQDQKGIAIGDGRRDYEGRLNANFSIWDGVMDIIIHSQFLQVERDLRSSSSQFNQALKLNPTISPYSSENESGYNVLTGGNDVFNPVADVMLKQVDRREQWISADAMFRLHLPWDLTAQTTFGWQNKNRQNTTYYDSHHKNCVDNGYHGSGSHGYTRWLDLSSETTLSWDRMFGDHKVNAVAGYSFLENRGSESFSMSNYDFVIDGIGAWDMGKGTWLSEGDAGMSSHKDPRSRLVSFFGRANWSWRNRYMLMASVRHEGSSKFGINHRWGTFWSLSGGWRISHEAFMKDISWLDDLKLRVGYGITGNNNFSSGVTVPTYSSNSFWIYDGQWVVSYGHSKNVNNDLHWEEKSELNVGLDWSVLGNRLFGKVDIYRRAVDGMLYSIRVPQPPAIYETTTMNYGNLENHGWEFEIGGVPVRGKNWRWSTTLRLSHNESTITSLWGNNTYSDRVEFPSPGNPGTGGRMEEGTRVGQYFIWKYAGLTEDGRWLVYNKDGDIILADDRKYEDKRYIGNAIPALIASWDHSVSYKNLTLTVNLRSWMKFDVFNTINMYYGLATDSGINVLRTAYIENRHIKQEKVLCDYWLEDGTFLKIDAVSLSYNWDTSKRSWGKYVRNANFYITMRDLACFTRYSGLNPEVNINGLDAGYEWFNSIYPQTARFTAGVKLTF